MSFTSVDLLPLMTSALASILVGSLWYAPWAFGRAWIDAISGGSTTDSGKTGLVLTPFNLFLAPVNALAASTALWIVFGWLEVDSILHAIGVAVVLWAGFSLTTTLWQVIYETRAFTVLLIDGGNQLVTYLVMAIILGAWKADYLPMFA